MCVIYASKIYLFQYTLSVFEDWLIQAAAVMLRKCGNYLLFRLATCNDSLEKCRLRIENKQKELGDVEQQLSQFDQNNLNNAK